MSATETIPTTSQTQRRARSRPSASALPAALVVAGCAVVLLGNGGVLPEARALGALLVAGSLAGLAAFSDARLARAEVARTIGMVWAALSLATAAGLLPLPHALLAFVARGTADARPDNAWWTVAVRPGDVVDSLAFGTLAASVTLAASAALVARRRPIHVLPYARIALACWVAFGLLHVATGSHSILGLIPHQNQVATFFAPMVNSNHFATVILLLLPSATFALRTRTAETFTAGLIAAIASIAVLLTGSVAAIALLPLAWLGHNVSAKRGLGLAAATVATAIVAIPIANVLHRDWIGDSMGGRLGHYQDALTLFPAFPVFGIGGGGFHAAFPRVDSDGVFHSLGHLHNDAAQWLLERGLFGALCVAAAALFLKRGWRPVTTEPARAPAMLGLLLVAIHSLVDFPLHLAGPAVATAAAAGLVLAAGARNADVAPGAVRKMLVGMAVLCLTAALWEARTAIANETLNRPVPTRLGLILFPNDPRVALFQGHAALRNHDNAAAAVMATQVAAEHPDDSNLLRKAAVLLAATGDATTADAWLQRAVERFPADSRAWIIRARLARADGNPVAVKYYAAALRAGPSNKALLDEAFAVLPVSAAWVDELQDAPAYTLILLSKRARAEQDPWAEADALWRAIERNPEAYGTLADLGPVLARAGKPAEGEAWLRHLVADDRRHWRAWLALGELLADDGKPEQAVGALLTAGDGLPNALARAVDVTWSFAGVDAARVLLTRLEQEGRMNPWLHLAAARLDESDGQTARCEQRILREGLSDGPPVAAEAKSLLARCTR